MKFWLKNRGVAPTVILASMVAALALFVVLGAAGGFAGSNLSAWANYYGRSLAGSFAGFFYTAILFICLGAIALVIWSLGGAFLSIIFPKWRRTGANNNAKAAADPREIFIAAARRSREMLLVIPAVLFVAIVALAMGEANMFAPVRLQDAVIIGLEHALFGNYVFAALGAIHYPHWLIAFIVFSFENMALILIGAGIVLSFIARERFRELLIAFCIGILAMFPLWLMVPVLSPQDRFINNVYHLPDSQQLALAVANYHPQPEIANFLQTIRTGKAGLPALPTSTIPSAHIFWAALAGYYLFRAKKWLGWVALPFLLASSFGTVLLAQHYFLDVPAGLAVAALAIWLAHGATSAAAHETPDALPEVVYR
jgi:hypothetical protein